MCRGRRYKLLYRVITLSPMSRRAWRPLSLVDRWCQCNMCGWSGVLSGVLAACVVVCAIRAVVSRSVFCPVGVPCVGLLVRRYAPWCKISWFHLYLELSIAHFMDALAVALFPYVAYYMRSTNMAQVKTTQKDYTFRHVIHNIWKQCNC